MGGHGMHDVKFTKNQLKEIKPLEISGAGLESVKLYILEYGTPSQEQEAKAKVQNWAWIKMQNYSAKPSESPCLPHTHPLKPPVT